MRCSLQNALIGTCSGCFLYFSRASALSNSLMSTASNAFDESMSFIPTSILIRPSICPLRASSLVFIVCATSVGVSSASVRNFHITICLIFFILEIVSYSCCCT